MKKIKQITICIMIVAILINILPVSYVSAASVKIAPKRTTMSVDKKRKIKVTGAKHTVKWKTSNKKIITIREKTKNTATIYGLSAGKAKIKAYVDGKTLTCNVVVKGKKQNKHIHNYTIPATCTTPASCSCGKTFGVALGHNMSVPTCQAPSTCSRCGFTSGSAVAHSYDQNNYCIWCHQFNLKSVLAFEMTNTSIDGNLDVYWVGVYCKNNGGTPFTVLGGTNPAIVYPTANTATPINTYLTDENDCQLYSDVCQAYGNKLFFFDTMSQTKFTFLLDGTISFYGQYNGVTYLFKVHLNGTAWTYEYSKV